MRTSNRGLDSRAKGCYSSAVPTFLIALALLAVPLSRLAAEEGDCSSARRVVDFKTGEQCLRTADDIELWWKEWGIDSKPTFTMRHWKELEMSAVFPGVSGDESVDLALVGRLAGVRAWVRPPNSSSVIGIEDVRGKTLDFKDTSQRWEFVRLFVDAMEAENKGRREKLEKDIESRLQGDKLAPKRSSMLKLLGRKDKQIAAARDFLSLLTQVEKARKKDASAPALPDLFKPK